MTFDELVPEICSILKSIPLDGEVDLPLYVNRDVNGRIRIVVECRWQKDPARWNLLEEAASRLHAQLGSHGFESPNGILLETDIKSALFGVKPRPLAGLQNAYLLDRLATETTWESIVPETQTALRVVFYSIKGGVGRSTALGVTAWALAEQGKRVLVLDMDLESPGISSSILPDDRRPKFGIADWLVEDLTGNSDEVFSDMIATSEVSRDGQIWVVPAHGREPGEYVSKLGRVWMPKLDSSQNREVWHQRLSRLIRKLEEELTPDIILIDSRAGIDEIGSACITDLGANLILLFAIDGDQTWVGYRILFDHWRQSGVVRDIRKRLQLVGAMVPEVNSREYLEGLVSNSWNVFSEFLYDEVPAEASSDSFWNFDIEDEDGHHYPWAIRWNRGFSALAALHPRIQSLDPVEANSVFGPLIQGIQDLTAAEANSDGN